MSIASEIQALQQDKTDIATAISNKGVTVPSGSGFDSFAGLIASISKDKKMAYREMKISTVKQFLEFDNLDFVPKGCLFLCNDTPARINENNIQIEGKESWGVSMFVYIPIGYIGNENTVAKTYGVIKTSGTPAISARNTGVTQITVESSTQYSGKYKATIGQPDSGNRYYRFVGFDTSLVVQAVFFA